MVAPLFAQTFRSFFLQQPVVHPAFLQQPVVHPANDRFFTPLFSASSELLFFTTPLFSHLSALPPGFSLASLSRIPSASAGGANVQTIRSVSMFRMNTYKSVSKQRTLTTFRMTTYAKTGGRGSTDSTLARQANLPPVPLAVHFFVRPAHIRPSEPNRYG